MAFRKLGKNGICSKTKVLGHDVFKMWIVCHRGKILLLPKHKHPSLQSLPLLNFPDNLLNILLTWSCRAAEKEPWTFTKLMLPNFKLKLVNSQLANSFINNSSFQRATVPKLCIDSEGILNFGGKCSDICWTPSEQLLWSCSDLITLQVKFFVLALRYHEKFLETLRALWNKKLGNLCPREFPRANAPGTVPLKAQELFSLPCSR